jgi:hypothetical protein
MTRFLRTEDCDGNLYRSRGREIETEQIAIEEGPPDEKKRERKQGQVMQPVTDKRTADAVLGQRAPDDPRRLWA